MEEMDKNCNSDKSVNSIDTPAVDDRANESKKDDKKGRGKNKKRIFKKWWFWTIIAIVVVGIISGAGNSADPENPDNTPPAACEHSYILQESGASCTLGGYDTYKCSKCSKTRTEYKSALGHTTSDGTCSRCGKSFSAWQISYYVDEFKNPADEAYITNTDVFLGTFSNSATTNSKLYVKILIDENDISIRLWEYGSHEVKAYTNTSYTISILDDSETKHSVTGTMYKNGNRIFLPNNDLIELLKSNTQLKIHIQENSSYGVNSTYLFTVDCTGFESTLQSYIKASLDDNSI